MPTSPTDSTVPFDRNDPFVRLFLGYAGMLARYHRHRVLHLERLGSLLRKDRRVILVGNHVLDVLDPLLFTATLIERYGRLPHFIGHENLIFRMPGLGGLARLSFADLTQESGLGEAKAAELQALFQLALRFGALVPEEKPTIRSPQDVFALLGGMVILAGLVMMPKWNALPAGAGKAKS